MSLEAYKIFCFCKTFVIWSTTAVSKDVCECNSLSQVLSLNIPKLALTHTFTFCSIFNIRSVETTCFLASSQQMITRALNQNPGMPLSKRKAWESPLSNVTYLAKVSMRTETSSNYSQRREGSSRAANENCSEVLWSQAAIPQAAETISCVTTARRLLSSLVPSFFPHYVSHRFICVSFGCSVNPSWTNLIK